MTQEERDYIETTLVTLALLGYTIKSFSYDDSPTSSYSNTYYILESNEDESEEWSSLGSLYINKRKRGPSKATDYRMEKLHMSTDIKELCDWILERFN